MSYEPAPGIEELVKAVSKATRVSKKLWRLFEGKHDVSGANEERKTRLIVLTSATHVTLQHFEAMRAIIRAGDSPASAYALFRPLVESTVRGDYLMCFGGDLKKSDSVIARFLRSEKRALPPFETMLDALDREHNSSFYALFTEQVYRGMCDYTHTGAAQVALNVSAAGVAVQGFECNDLAKLLQAATIFTCTSMAVMFLHLGEDRKAEECRELATD